MADKMKSAGYRVVRSYDIGDELLLEVMLPWLKGERRMR